MFSHKKAVYTNQIEEKKSVHAVQVSPPLEKEAAMTLKLDSSP